jgi:hypothetical protein
MDFLQLYCKEPQICRYFEDNFHHIFCEFETNNHQDQKEYKVKNMKKKLYHSHNQTHSKKIKCSCIFIAKLHLQIRSMEYYPHRIHNQEHIL